MRIITSNIWGDYFNNPVSVREEQLYRIWRKYGADIIGLQEVTPGWYESKLMKELSGDYFWVGTERYSDFNYVPMAVKKEYKLYAGGFEYLEETPDASKAITWAVIENPGVTPKFAVCNTHFWWKTGPEHDEIRAKNAQQLSALMQHLQKKYACPVFAFGDMNTRLNSEVFKVYATCGIGHLYDLAEEKDNVSSHHGDPVLGDDGKYHGTITQNDKNASIDHMVALGSGFSVSQYRIVQDQDALDATDHSPVYTDILFD